MNGIQNVGVNPQQQLKPNFKAETKTANRPMSQQDIYIKMYEEQKKKEKSQNRKQNISLASQIVLSGAFAAMAVTSVLQYMKGSTKAAKTVFSKLDNMIIANDSLNPKVRNFIDKSVKMFSKPSNIINHAGAKNPPKMVLFWGSTGTGKTFSAKVFAKKMGAEYGEVQFSELSSAYIGETSVNITKKFAELAALAKKNPDKKYVVAFNEIDSLINNIDKLGSNNLHLGQNRTSFLNGLDSIKDIPNLTIVGTTNVNPHSANLDPATLSRLGFICEIPKPEVSEIVAALKYHLKKSPAAADLINDKANLEKIAKEIHAKQGVQRDVENIVDSALSDFALSIDNVQEKFTPTYLEKVIADKEVWAAAIGSPKSMEEEVAQFLEKPGVLDYLAKLFGSNKPSA